MDSSFTPPPPPDSESGSHKSEVGIAPADRTFALLALRAIGNCSRTFTDLTSSFQGIMNALCTSKRLLLLAMAVLMAAVALFASPPPAEAQAEAQTVKDLVSNRNLTQNAWNSRAAEYTQAFRTGNNPGGYLISSVTFDMYTGNTAGATTTVTIRRNRPGWSNDGIVATLSGTAGDGFQTYTAPADTILARNTTYWLVVNDGISSSGVLGGFTQSDGETSDSGWTIANEAYWRELGETSASDWNTTVRTAALRMSVRGSLFDRAPTPVQQSRLPYEANRTIVVRWNKYVQEADRSSFTRYSVRVKHGSATQWINLTDINTTRHNLRHRVNGRTYRVAVGTCNNHGCAYSREYDATPTPLPSLVRSYQPTVADGSITLTWDKYTQEEIKSSFARYEVHLEYEERTDDNRVVKRTRKWNVSDINTTSYTWTNPWAVNGRPVHVWVRVCNADGCGSYLGRWPATPSNQKPGPVPSYQPTVSKGAITLNWEKYVERSIRSPFTKYRLHHKLKSASSWTTTDVTDINAISRTLSGLTNHVPYQAYVTVCNQYGCSGNGGTTWEVTPGLAVNASVGNLSGSRGTAANMGLGRSLANSFTTGGTATDRYSLSNVVLNFRHSTDKVKVRIHANNNGVPGAQIGSDLVGGNLPTAIYANNPSGGHSYFYPRAGSEADRELHGATTYFVVVEWRGSSALLLTSSDAQTGSTGWLIGDKCLRSHDDFGQPRWNSGDGSVCESNSIQISVNVQGNLSAPSPVASRQATVRSGEITLTWDKYVQEASKAPFTKYRVHLQYPVGTTISTTDVTNINTTSHTWTGLVNDREYQVFVDVCNFNACSTHGGYAWRATPNNRPPRPVNSHRPTAGDKSIRLTWDKYVQETDRAPFTKYQVAYHRLR